MKNKPFDLPVKIGNVTLRNPFVVGSGPTVENLEHLELIEKCGWRSRYGIRVLNGRGEHAHSG